MSEKEIIHEILKRALDADERGEKEQAVAHYTNAVELILKISDSAIKDSLNKYAVQALDRAEELRGISSAVHKTVSKSIDEEENPSSNYRNESNCSIVLDVCIQIKIKSISF